MDISQDVTSQASGYSGLICFNGFLRLKACYSVLYRLAVYHVIHPVAHYIITYKKTLVGKSLEIWPARRN